MKGEKLLAEWFWTDRWMGSSGFLVEMPRRGIAGPLFANEATP